MRLAAALLVGIFLLVYLPDMGQGFVSDDFRWIRQSRLTTAPSLVRLFTQDNGFYRPIVSLTFAADHALWGLFPFGYAATNLVLALGVAAAWGAVARAAGLAPAFALTAAALWLFNPHGIPMAILWISGRTSLLLCLFSALAAWAVLRRRPVAAAALALAAMLSKEEAVVLPLVLALWAAFSPEGGWRWSRRAGAEAAVVGSAWVPYFLLRSQTAAYLPTTAPDFYRPTLDAATLLRNVAEYADRAGTVSVAAVLLMAVCVRRRPTLTSAERALVLLGLAWLVGGYGLTVFLPVRSSLYAAFPSMGAALAAAAALGALWRTAEGWPQRALPIAALVVPLLLLPVYRGRARRWVKPATLSSSVLALLKEVPAGDAVVLYDAVGARPNLESTFGSLLGDAVRLHRPDLRVWREPASTDWIEDGLLPPLPGQAIRRFSLREGRLQPAVAQ